MEKNVPDKIKLSMAAFIILMKTHHYALNANLAFIYLKIKNNATNVILNTVQNVPLMKREMSNAMPVFIVINSLMVNVNVILFAKIKSVLFVNIVSLIKHINNVYYVIMVMV